MSSETLGWLLWGTMVGLGVAGVVAAVLALSGRWRRWVFFPRMLLSVVPFTTFPLVSGFMGLGLVSFVWWPRQWMPAWHRDWMRQGGDDLTDPWADEPGRG
ncbi:hypothetical protein [Micrococcus terreus]|uniref:hypothetical protein n=1 Tax=Micrococcus terreus TaxID=574650 RepID=UPI002550BF4E|nr:hypothetical protein [Micrococcus terreus]MDK7701769.1 hypothetical protein [Micrococcus terreus]WOO96710.1 hypothetical protein R3I42_09180 [Micrococcus terreus]